MGATYAIPIIYVPVLTITHVVAFYLMLRPKPKAARTLADDAAASSSEFKSRLTLVLYRMRVLGEE